MVTLPSPSAPHQHQEIAESFGSDADRYDRARPRYPRALVDAVMAGLGGGRVLDVGIGTGLSALPFRDAGCRVLGVETDPRMAEVARSRGFEVEVARFEDWESPGALFDAVIAGQAWHWIDPVAGAAKAASVLRPGGRLAPFWNVGDPEPRIAAAFGRAYEAVDTGLPFNPFAGDRSAIDGYEAILARTEAGIRGTGAFAEPERLRLDWTSVVTTRAWLDQVPTMGGHSRIPAARLGELLDRLGEIVDADGGSFVMNYATVALTADRRPGD